MGYGPCDCKELDMTEKLHYHTLYFYRLHYGHIKTSPR